MEFQRPSEEVNETRALALIPAPLEKQLVKWEAPIEARPIPRSDYPFSFLEMTIAGNLAVQVGDGQVKFTAIKPPRGWKPKLQQAGGLTGKSEN
jgi:hypothetical protein